MSMIRAENLIKINSCCLIMIKLSNGASRESGFYMNILYGITGLPH